MRERLRIFFSLFVFWMVFFSLTRWLFLAYNYQLTSQLTAVEILKTCLYGLVMDASMTGYFTLISGLFLITSVFHQSKLSTALFIGINFALLLVSGLVVVVDFELYRHWGFRMNTAPFFYMGSEAAGTVDALVVLRLLLLLTGITGLATYTFVKLVGKKFQLQRPNYNWPTFFALTAIICALIIPIRGSFSVSTMNVSRVYYHKSKSYANHAGINVVWNFLYSLQTDNELIYPENFFDKTLSEKYFKELYPESDSTTIRLINTARPNILLIILEGITAEVIEPLGGRPGVMPNLNSLCKEGILFDHFYANGDRTDKGLVSLLAAFPAQPRGSIIKYPQKTQQLGFLSSSLEKLGYTTSFVYGGDVDFANYRSFLTNGRFAHITTVDDFPDELDAFKWGVHDEYVYHQTLLEIDSTNKQPFFKTVLTLSSHEPFRVPMPAKISGTDEASKYMNACYYADKALGDFIKVAKEKNWWKNTLVIITADHGHRLPGMKKPETHEKFHIPMVWTGGVIVRDTVIKTFANQTDLANTLLGQLERPDPKFRFSKDIFAANAQDFAIYIFNDGYGYLTPYLYAVYDNPGRHYLISQGNMQEESLNRAKAYIQTLYSDYNSKR
ncbi:MAG: LTA synthase family protein [Cyclobacteriaceae bacterium]|nr:LTA synthase family protein [Cyclobacteriaceae bacterium]